LDVAEIEAHIKRARRLEQFGEDGLAEWQAAYELASQGPFLPGEVYSDWAQGRRQQLETSLWECIQVLWPRFVEQGASGEAEALRILRDYWHSHVTSEDALRPLLELLGKRECFGEAQGYYEQLCAALGLEGKQPDQRTQEVMDFQRTVQLQRKQVNINKNGEIRNAQLLFTSSLKANDRWKSNAGQKEHTDIHFLVEGQQSVQTLATGIQVMKESRRRLLQQMFSLAGGTLLAPQVLFKTALAEQFTDGSKNAPQVDNATLTHLETITRNHWYLFLRAASKGDLLSGFWEHFQTLLQFLSYPLPGAMRNHLYSLVGESAQMIGEVLFDMQDYHHAQMYYHFSIYAAKEAGNNTLRAVGLGRMSFLPIYRNEPLQALPLLEEAKQLLLYVPRSLIHSWLAVVEAEVMAHLHDEVACEKALERARANYYHEASEDDLLWTRLNDATILGYKGACYLQLHLPQKALASLQETLAFIPAYSPRHQSLIITDMAAALLQMGEFEESCRLLHQVLEDTTQTRSLLILTRMQCVRKNLERWKDTSSVQKLDSAIAEILPRILM
jgi:tetratricopeptide (TPR) repeat protein